MNRDIETPPEFDPPEDEFDFSDLVTDGERVPRRSRPLGVTLLAIYFIGTAVVACIIFMFSLGAAPAGKNLLGIPQEVAVVLYITMTVVFVAWGFRSGTWMLSGHRGGWWLVVPYALATTLHNAVLMIGFGLFGEELPGIDSDVAEQYLIRASRRLVVRAAILSYLFQKNVQKWFKFEADQIRTTINRLIIFGALVLLYSIAHFAILLQGRL